MIRSTIRTILHIRKNETVSDGINRHFYKFKKRIDHRDVSLDQFKELIEKVGIKNGDTIIVHSSWRALYALKASPNDVIDILLECIGNEGTMIMPSATVDKSFLDVINTPSKSGVLTEVFRNYPGVIRSEFPDSPMISLGKNSERILSQHINSTYTFDKNSPYFIAFNECNAKVLFLGMGKSPHKISIFHCATYNNKDLFQYENVFHKVINSNVITPTGEKLQIHYNDRLNNISNNKVKFRKLFRTVKKKAITFNGLSLTLFSAKDAFEIADEYCRSGGFLYKDSDKRSL